MKKDRDLAIQLITYKINKKTTLTYNEIAKLSGYHSKYILKLKSLILNNELKEEHGNKNRKPFNAISKEEEEKIVNLYKRANASIKEFARFYGKRSYSCIYNVLKKNNLI